jgi:hypothetical protein
MLLSFLFFQKDMDAQRNRNFFDGPYITVNEDKKDILWIQKGKVMKESIMSSDTIDFFNVPNLPKVDLHKLDFDIDTTLSYSEVSHFAAISDIHGQHDLFIELLTAQGIIDSLQNWSYGEGHLVIVGDIFDRGDKVTESLWFLFDLEKQAKKAGGKVHVLLGNHEVMVLHGDIGYINPKYRYTSGASRTPYPDLFTDKTVLGQWLRSKKITVTINDFVFVHGGFSKKVIDKENSLSQINKVFKDEILPERAITYDTTEFISNLYFENGPLWYRGYAHPEGFDSEQAEYILGKLDKESIIVGHTSMPQVMSLFDNRVVLVDSSIKFGKSGELLIFEDDILYRGLLNGDKLLLDSDNKNDKRSIFDYLFEVADSNTIVTLKTDVKLLKKNKAEKEYQPSVITLSDDLDEPLVFETRVKVRGNMRKKLCTLPPLKIDFNKADLRNHGFSNKDKVKLVLQCMDFESQVISVKKEHLVYELYRQIDTLGLRSKLINVNLISENNERELFQGFILEDEENLARRVGGKVIEKGIVRPQSMQRESYLKMVFFQYMICNTDFSISGRHNIETILLDDEIRLFAVAYDFDYAGIVGQEYAVPSDIFPIMDVDQRYFRLNDLTKDELKSMRKFYNDERENLNKIIQGAVYLSEKERNRFNSVVDDFYKIINSKRKSKVLLGVEK